MLPRYRLPRRIGTREVAALAALALSIAMAEPSAGQPSPEQIDTIRQACRSDYIAHCSSVQPGGREALQCLERNAAQLSTECGSAVSAAVPKAETRPQTRPEATPESPQPAAAAAPQPSPQDQLAAVGPLARQPQFGLVLSQLPGRTIVLKWTEDNSRRWFGLRTHCGTPLVWRPTQDYQNFTSMRPFAPTLQRT